MTRIKKQRPTRTVKLLQGPDGLCEVWTVQIREGDKVDCYDVAQATVGGRFGVWLWRKVLANVWDTCDQVPYTVDVGNEFGDSCTCKGHERWGKCRHVTATKALLAAGKLPALEQPASTVDVA